MAKNDLSKQGVTPSGIDPVEYSQYAMNKRTADEIMPGLKVSPKPKDQIRTDEIMPGLQVQEIPQSEYYMPPSQTIMAVDRPAMIDDKSGDDSLWNLKWLGDLRLGAQRLALMKPGEIMNEAQRGWYNGKMAAILDHQSRVPPSEKDLESYAFANEAVSHIPVNKNLIKFYEGTANAGETADAMFDVALSSMIGQWSYMFHQAINNPLAALDATGGFNPALGIMTGQTQASMAQGLQDKMSGFNSLVNPAAAATDISSRDNMFSDYLEDNVLLQKISDFLEFGMPVHKIPNVKEFLTTASKVVPPVVVLGKILENIPLPSMALEYSGKFNEIMGKEGVDLTNKDELRQWFSDPNNVNSARKKAIQAGLPVQVFDAMSMAVGGKILAPAINAAAKKGVALPAWKYIGLGLAEAGVQGALGMAGEVGKQVTLQEGYNWPDILAEGLAEIFPMGAVEVTAGTLSRIDKTDVDQKAETWKNKIDRYNEIVGESRKKASQTSPLSDDLETDLDKASKDAGAFLFGETPETQETQGGTQQAQPEQEEKKIVSIKPKGRADIKRAMTDVFGFNEEESGIIADVWDAVAGVWAKKNGKNKSDWYSSRIGEITNAPLPEDQTGLFQGERTLGAYINTSIEQEAKAFANNYVNEADESFAMNQVPEIVEGLEYFFKYSLLSLNEDGIVDYAESIAENLPGMSASELVNKAMAFRSEMQQFTDLHTLDEEAYSEAFSGISEWVDEEEIDEEDISEENLLVDRQLPSEFMPGEQERKSRERRLRIEDPSDELGKLDRRRLLMSLPFDRLPKKFKDLVGRELASDLDYQTYEGVDEYNAPIILDRKFPAGTILTEGDVRDIVASGNESSRYAEDSNILLKKKGLGPKTQGLSGLLFQVHGDEIASQGEKIFNSAEKALKNITQKKATAAQFKSMLLKNGMKEDHLKFMSWDDAFENPDEVLHIDEIEEYISMYSMGFRELVLHEKHGLGPGIVSPEATSRAKQKIQASSERLARHVRDKLFLAAKNSNLDSFGYDDLQENSGDTYQFGRGLMPITSNTYIPGGYPNNSIPAENQYTVAARLAKINDDSFIALVGLDIDKVIDTFYKELYDKVLSMPKEVRASVAKEEQPSNVTGGRKWYEGLSPDVQFPTDKIDPIKLKDLILDVLKNDYGVDLRTSFAGDTFSDSKAPKVKEGVDTKNRLRNTVRMYIEANWHNAFQKATKMLSFLNETSDMSLDESIFTQDLNRDISIYLMLDFFKQDSPRVTLGSEIKDREEFYAHFGIKDKDFSHFSPIMTEFFFDNGLGGVYERLKGELLPMMYEDAVKWKLKVENGLGKVDKTRIQERANGVAKFSQYTTGKGKEYREYVYTLNNDTQKAIERQKEGRLKSISDAYNVLLKDISDLTPLWDFTDVLGGYKGWQDLITSIDDNRNSSIDLLDELKAEKSKQGSFASKGLDQKIKLLTGIINDLDVANERLNEALDRVENVSVSNEEFYRRTNPLEKHELQFLFSDQYEKNNNFFRVHKEIIQFQTLMQRAVDASESAMSKFNELSEIARLEDGDWEIYGWGEAKTINERLGNIFNVNKDSSRWSYGVAGDLVNIAASASSAIKMYASEAGLHMKAMFTNERKTPFHNLFYYENKAHWEGTYNPLFHMRAVEEDGYLYLEEIQSDWAQAQRRGHARGHPFESSNKWVEIALRRALIDAMRDGLNGVAWTNGDIQANRYAGMKPDEKEGLKKFYDVNVVNVAKKLANKLGAEVVERKFGKDNAFAINLTEKAKSKLLGTEDLLFQDFEDDTDFIRRNNPLDLTEKQRTERNKQIAQVNRDRKISGKEIVKDPYYSEHNEDGTGKGPINDDTAEALKRLEPIWSEMRRLTSGPKKQGAHGAIRWDESGRAIIHALTDPNVSTPIHELAHIFELDLDEADRAAVLEWSGEEEWNTTVREKFARGFERYLREGKAPNTKLEKVFAHFKEWLRAIYKVLKGSPIEEKLSPKMRDIFDRVLATPEVDITPTEKAVEETKAQRIAREIKEGSFEKNDNNLVDVNKVLERSKMTPEERRAIREWKDQYMKERKAARDQKIAEAKKKKDDKKDKQRVRSKEQGRKKSEQKKSEQKPGTKKAKTGRVLQKAPKEKVAFKSRLADRIRTTDLQLTPGNLGQAKSALNTLNMKKNEGKAINEDDIKVIEAWIDKYLDAKEAKKNAGVESGLKDVEKERTIFESKNAITEEEMEIAREKKKRQEELKEKKEAEEKAKEKRIADKEKSDAAISEMIDAMEKAGIDKADINDLIEVGAETGDPKAVEEKIVSLNKKYNNRIRIAAGKINALKKKIANNDWDVDFKEEYARFYTLLTKKGVSQSDIIAAWKERQQEIKAEVGKVEGPKAEKEIAKLEKEMLDNTAISNRIRDHRGLKPLSQSQLEVITGPAENIRGSLLPGPEKKQKRTLFQSQQGNTIPEKLASLAKKIETRVNWRVFKRFAAKVNETLPIDRQISDKAVREAWDIYEARRSAERGSELREAILKEANPAQYKTKTAGKVKGKKLHPSALSLLEKIYHNLTKQKRSEAAVLEEEIVTSTDGNITKKGFEGDFMSMLEDSKENELYDLQFWGIDDMTESQLEWVAKEVASIVEDGKSQEKSRKAGIKKEIYDKRSETQLSILGLRGEVDVWQAGPDTEVYEEGTEVFYEGKIYVANQPVPANVKPSDTKSEAWDVVVSYVDWSQFNLTKKGIKELPRSVSQKKKLVQAGEILKRKSFRNKARLQALGFSYWSKNWYTFLATLGNFDQSGNELGQSWVELELGQLVNMAEELEKKQIRKYSDELHNKTIEIWGKGREGDEKFKSFTIDDREFTFTDKHGRSHTFEWTEDTALSLWMQLRDPSLEKTIEKQFGNSPKELSSQLEKQMSPEAIELGEYMLYEFYPEYYERVNSVYTDIYGAPLPKPQNFSPIQREGATIFDNDDWFNPGLSHIAVVTNNSLRARQMSTKPLEPMSALRVHTEYVNKMERFINFAPVLRTLRGIFNNPGTTAMMSNVLSSKSITFIRNELNNLATKGEQRQSSLSALDRIRANIATSVLGLNPKIFFTQMTSFVTFAGEMPLNKWLAGVSKVLLNPMKAIDTLYSRDFLVDRMMSGMNRDVAIAIAKSERKTRLGLYRRIKRKNSVISLMMMPTKWGDTGAIVFGGYPLWEHVKSESMKNGMTEEEAMEQADFALARASKVSQQTQDISGQSGWQQGNAMFRIFTLFQSSLMAFNQQEAAAWGVLYNKKNNKLARNRAIRKLVIYHLIAPVLAQFVANGFRTGFGDDDDQAMKLRSRMLRAAAVGSLNGVFLLGNMIDTVTNHLIAKNAWKLLPWMDEVKEPILDISLVPGMTTPTRDLANLTKGEAKGWEAISNLVIDIFNGDIAELGEDLEEIGQYIGSKDSDAVAGIIGVISGLPIKKAKQMGTAIHTFGEDDSEYESILKAMGWTDWTLGKTEPRKLRRRTSSKATSGSSTNTNKKRGSRGSASK